MTTLFRFVTCLVVATLASCTAILAPRDDVQRCGNSQDCDQPEDKRFINSCKFGDNSDNLDSTEVDKVCVPEFRTDISCAPDSYGPVGGEDHPLTAAFAVHGVSSRYISGCTDNPGQAGCPEPCASGLSVNIHGVCDDGSFPPAVRADPGNEELVGQDVLDQFCRSIFCDDSFVCDRSGGQSICAPCSSEQPYGDGGCGDIYISGQRSCIYQTPGALENMCQAPNIDTAGSNFGSCPS